jgi:hypothetical protein
MSAIVFMASTYPVEENPMYKLLGKFQVYCKDRDIPLRKCQATSKAKTRKLKEFLKRKAEKERRSSAKQTLRVKTKQYFAGSIDEFDESICDSIQMEEYLVDLDAEDRAEDLAYSLLNDCCVKVLPGEVDFYPNCEQFLCQDCLNKEK